MANKWDNLFYIFIGFYTILALDFSLQNLSPIIISVVSILIYKFSYEYLPDKTGNIIRVILIIISAILFVGSLVILQMLLIYISTIQSLGGSAPSFWDWNSLAFIITAFILSFWYFFYQLDQREIQSESQRRVKADDVSQRAKQSEVKRYGQVKSKPASSQSVGFYDTPEWKSLVQQIRLRDNFTCQQCGLHGPKDGVRLGVHHVIPRSQGGGDDPSNLVTLCHDCHMSQPGHDFMRAQEHELLHKREPRDAQLRSKAHELPPTPRQSESQRRVKAHEISQKPKQREVKRYGQVKSKPVSSQSVGFYDTPEWKSLAQEIRIRDNFTCQQCGLHGPKDGVVLHVHHRTPRKQGGSDAPSNLVTLCHDCHMSQPGHEFMRGLCDKGKYADAIACCDRAPQIDQERVNTWVMEGLALDDKGKYADAIVCYNKALQIKPEYAYAWINKGNALHNLGMHADANDCFDKAEQLGLSV